MEEGIHHGCSTLYGARNEKLEMRDVRLTPEGTEVQQDLRRLNIGLEFEGMI